MTRFIEMNSRRLLAYLFHGPFQSPEEAASVRLVIHVVCVKALLFNLKFTHLDLSRRDSGEKKCNLMY